MPDSSIGPDPSEKANPDTSDSSPVSDVTEDDEEFVEFDLGDIELIETKVFG
jgi:hypothetical protein